MEPDNVIECEATPIDEVIEVDAIPMDEDYEIEPTSQLILVKIGNDNFPSNEEDVESLQKAIDKVKDEADWNLACHHAIQVETRYIPAPREAIVVLKIGNDNFPASEADVIQWKYIFLEKLTQVRENKGDVWWAVPHTLDVTVTYI